MEVKFRNSAGRLLSLLNSLDHGQGLGQQLIPVFLAKKIPTESKDISIEGARAISELHTLYAKVLEDLATADMNEDERNVLVRGLVQLQNMMYPHTITQPPRQVSQAELALLEMLAAKLPREPEIGSKDFDSIKESIEALKEAVNESPLDGVLRIVLLELIRLSEDAINRYHIYGAQGLKKAFKGMLAEVAEIYIQEDLSVEEVTQSSVWKKAVAHIKLFDKVAAKLMQYGPVLEKASKLLIGND